MMRLAGNRAAVERSISLSIEAAAVLAIFSALTLAVFWPTALYSLERVFKTPGGLQADGFLIAWAMAWDCHALATSPLDLFDANIFHPAENTLAGSEHMLGLLPFFAPAYWLTGSPGFAIQFTRLTSIAACGVTMYFLLRHWRCQRVAALVGSFVYALCPARYLGIHALQAVALPYLPLAVLFLDRTMKRGRVGDAIAASVFFTLQMLCSYYLAYTSVIAISVFSAVAACFGRVRHWRPTLLSCGVAMILVAASGLPYLDWAAQGAIKHHPDEMLSAVSAYPWSTYLTRPRPSGFQRPGAYVGLLPLLLCCLALASLRSRRAMVYPTVAMLAVATVLYVLALGPLGTIGSWTFSLPYRWLRSTVPGFVAMRVPLRFCQGVMFGFAALVGIGADSVVTWRRWRRWRMAAVTTMAVGAIALDYGHFEYEPRLQRAPVPAAVHRALAELEAGPVLEIPALLDGGDSIRRVDLQARYMFQSTAHWKPLLNGYTGHAPPSAALVMRLASALPDERALELLQRSTGLRYLIVHLGLMAEHETERWQQWPGLRLLERFGDDLLFEVGTTIEADLQPALLAGLATTHTMLGAELLRLNAAAQAGGVEVSFPKLRDQEVSNGFPVSLTVRVDNRSRDVWPVLAENPDLVVRAVYQWWRGDSLVKSGEVDLPYDLEPGRHARFLALLATPKDPGSFELRLWLAQGERKFNADEYRVSVGVGHPDGRS